MKYIRSIKDKSARHIMLGIAIFSLLLLLVIGVSLFLKALPIMKEKSLWVLLTSGNWKPFKGEFGFLPYILSTLYVSVIAIVIALPLSLADQYLSDAPMHQKVYAGFLNRLSIFFPVYLL